MIYNNDPRYFSKWEEHEHDRLYNLVWWNFVRDGNCDFGWRADEEIKKWNGVWIGDGVIFETEQDKMWFMLRWS